jgi:hypothetical protein
MTQSTQGVSRCLIESLGEAVNEAVTGFHALGLGPRVKCVVIAISGAGRSLRLSERLDDDRPGAPTIGCLEPLGEVIGLVGQPDHETVVPIDELERAYYAFRAPQENIR